MKKIIFGLGVFVWLGAFSLEASFLTPNLFEETTLVARTDATSSLEEKTPGRGGDTKRKRGKGSVRNGEDWGSYLDCSKRQPSDFPESKKQKVFDSVQEDEGLQFSETRTFVQGQALAEKAYQASCSLRIFLHSLKGIPSSSTPYSNDVLQVHQALWLLSDTLQHYYCGECSSACHLLDSPVTASPRMGKRVSEEKTPKSDDLGAHRQNLTPREEEQSRKREKDKALLLSHCEQWTSYNDILWRGEALLLEMPSAQAQQAFILSGRSACIRVLSSLCEEFFKRSSPMCTDQEEKCFPASDFPEVTVNSSEQEVGPTSSCVMAFNPFTPS